MSDRPTAANAAPDLEQIRRRMLNIARLDGSIHADGYVPAGNYRRAADDEGRRLGDDGVAAVVEQLVEWGLLEEQAAPPTGGAAREHRHKRFRLTRKGWALWSGEIPPIPGVADERL